MSKTALLFLALTVLGGCLPDGVRAWMRECSRRGGQINEHWDGGTIKLHCEFPAGEERP
jgi:hypothetical protein